MRVCVCVISNDGTLALQCVPLHGFLVGVHLKGLVVSVLALFIKIIHRVLLAARHGREADDALESPVEEEVVEAPQRGAVIERVALGFRLVAVHIALGWLDDLLQARPQRLQRRELNSPKHPSWLQQLRFNDALHSLETVFLGEVLRAQCAEVVVREAVVQCQDEIYQRLTAPRVRQRTHRRGGQ